MNLLVKLFSVLTLSVLSVHATVVYGNVSELLRSLPDKSLQALAENSTLEVQVVLQNCSTGTPRLDGFSLIVPTNKTLGTYQAPTVTGALESRVVGTVIGNDVIDCDGVVGSTYYKVDILSGGQPVYQMNCLIIGPYWNIETVVPVSPEQQEQLRKEVVAAKEAKVAKEAAEEQSRAIEEAAATVARALEEAREAHDLKVKRAICKRVYARTVDKKVSNLTVRDTQLVRACQSIDLYPPE